MKFGYHLVKNCLQTFESGEMQNCSCPLGLENAEGPVAAMQCKGEEQMRNALHLIHKLDVIQCSGWLVQLVHCSGGGKD